LSHAAVGSEWHFAGIGDFTVSEVVDVWSERRDLNPGPPVPQTGALTGLRYAPPTGHLYDAAAQGARAGHRICCVIPGLT
jgi:hypothetical protein